jgi:membrane fusion protein (multidrug efflux system)
MTEHLKRRFSGWLAAVVGLALAVALAGYGIWSRQTSVTNLQYAADDAALSRVQVVSPKDGPSTQALALPGEVRAWNEAPIYGQVSGYVTQWFKDYGAHVDAGDLLATIETPSLDAQLAAAKASLAVAQTRYNLSAETAKRYDALTTAAVTQQQKDQMDANAAADKAQVAAAEQTVQQYEAMTNFKRIVAPFAGVVTSRRVSVGDFINSVGGAANQQSSAPPPFSVADVSKLRVFISVPQAYGGVLKPGLKADLTLPGDPSRKIPAQFLTMAGAVVPSTRTIVTELVVESPQDGLWPGAYVNVHLTFPTDPNVLVIPSQALLFRANGMQVALVDDQNHVRLRNVTLGRNLGLDVEITAGLKATDKIVANPSLGLLEGQQVKVVQAARGYEPRRDQGGGATPAPSAPTQAKPIQDPNAPASQASGDGAHPAESP